MFKQLTVAAVLAATAVAANAQTAPFPSGATKAKTSVNKIMCGTYFYTNDADVCIKWLDADTAQKQKAKQEQDAKDFKEWSIQVGKCSQKLAYMYPNANPVWVQDQCRNAVNAGL